MSASQLIETAPKDGTEILLPLECNVRAYWCPELETWVLSRPLHVETMADPKQWQRMPDPTRPYSPCRGTGRTPKDAST